MTQTTLTPREVKDRLLAAIEPHVPFDGWNEVAFRAAVSDSGLEPAVARGICPRGAVDLALHYHEQGDEEMLRRIRTTDMGEMKFREKVTAAVRFRLEAVADREMVRRGATLFALPQYSADGAKAIWGTVDKIWVDLGDSSRI